MDRTRERWRANRSSCVEVGIEVKSADLVMSLLYNIAQGWGCLPDSISNFSDTIEV